MNQMDEAGRDRVRVSAPKLGTMVELVEGNVAEILALRDAPVAEDADPDKRGATLVWQVLALSLRVDGRRFSVDDLMAMGASKFQTLIGLSTQAMELNGFYAVETDETGEDVVPKD